MNEQAMKHATFLRRYMLRQGCELATTPDEVGIFDAILFLESLNEKPVEKAKRLNLTTRKPRPLKR